MLRSQCVFDGIVDGLGHSDHDITINIIVQVEFLLRIVNEAFNHSNIFHYGWNLDTDRIHEYFTDFIWYPFV